MHSCWDRVARRRHLQLLQGEDITFSKVFLPVILRVLHEQDNHAAFTVLDVGCGTGVLTHQIAEHVHYIIGIDPSQASISIAEEYTREKRNAAVENLGIEDYARNHQGQFDFAIAHMTLQVIENLDLALKSTSIVLKEGGRFLFSIPHPCFWAMVKDEVGTWTLIRDAAGKGDYRYLTSSSHENAFQVSTDDIIRVPYFHRPLEIYSSALSSAGFVIQRMIEPFPDDELMQKYREPWPYPRFLMGLCRKNDATEVSRCTVNPKQGI